MSNPEFPGSYQPDPRGDGLGGVPEGRRGRSSGRRSPGGGRAARGGGPGLTGSGGNGSGGYQAGGTDTGDLGRGWLRGGRQDAPRHGGRPGQAAVGPRETSGTRERYAAARERYAARVGAGRAAGVGGDTGALYAGASATDYAGNGHSGTGYDGTGYDGTGYDGTGRGGARPGGHTRQLAPGGRRLRGRSGNGGDGDDGSGSGGDGRERRKGGWWRHWTLKKAVGVVAALVGLMLVAGAAGVAVAYSKTPVPSQPQLAAIQAASTVYFSDNKTRVGQFGTFDRQPLAYSQIPAVLRNAVVAAEDKNFYHEGGISPTGIVRAAYNDLTSSGGSLQGGSTITQQLVRNYYANIGTAQTLSRKVKEIFVAQKLAQQKSKAWILTQYLNTVYFGDGAYGVGAAAQTYFGLSTPSQLSKITPAQAAMIAAMIQSPSYYSPDPKDGARYQGLVFRWHYVLGAMVNMGTLPQQSAAKATFPTVVKALNNTWGGYRGYIMNAVLYELEHTYHYSPHTIFNGGLHVISTFNQHLMNTLYATVRENRTLMRNGTPPPLPSAVTVASTGLPKFVHIGAVLEQPGTGAILAMYSGQNYKKTQYDDALQSRNQVGSSFKPYVLATAVKQGMNVQTSRLNGFSPLWIPPDSQPMTFASLTSLTGNSYYQVSNDEVSNPNRPVTPVEATALSLNTAYADLWHRVALNTATGQHNVVQMARDFGVDTSANASGLQTMRDEAGTALGQASLTVEEQATMIATLAAGGEYSTPHVIKTITVGNQVIQARVQHRQVLTADQAAEVDYAMSFDMGPLGTANGLGLTNGQTVIAKTGTTNLSQSAFFLGATQRYAMAVGMFVTHPGCTLPASEQTLCQSTAALAFTPPPGIQTLFGVGGYAGYGGQWPAIIWHDFYLKQFNSLPVQAWPAPPANYGSAWNLVGQLPKPKPSPRPSKPCFGFRCRGQNPSPAPTCLGGPFRCRSSRPTLPPSGGTGGTGGAAAIGGVAAGGLMAGSVMVALLPVGVRRCRPRRRRAGPAGQRKN